MNETVKGPILSTLLAAYELALAWQTLIGSLIALIAALWTIKVMRDQMKADTDRHHDAFRRKRLAARAMMPDALSALGAYVRGCAAYLIGNADALPAEPTAAITALKEVIEFIDDKAAERTFVLVSWYQVFKARMSADLPTSEKAEFADRQWDAALLFAYVNSLFEYARNEVDDIDTSKPSRDEMKDALQNAFTLVYMIQHKGQFVRVLEIIERRHESRTK